MAQITLDELNAMDRDNFVAALGEVFEHAPWVAETAFACAALCQPRRALRRHDGRGAQCRHRTARWLSSRAIPISPAKPRAKARSPTIPNASSRAPGSIDYPNEEFAAFHRLNDAYHSKFDIPFIVCVRRHGKESILRQFEQRLNNDAAAERDAALEGNLPDRCAAAGSARYRAGSA